MQCMKYNVGFGVEEEYIILEGPNVDLQSQSASLIESVCGFVAGIIPKNFFFKAYSSCVHCDVIEIQGLSVECEVVVWEFSVLSPILYCSKVERVKIDWSCFFSLSDGFDIVLFEQIENIFSDLAVVIEFSVHLGVFCFDQDSRQSIIRVSLPFVLFIESDNHFNNITEEWEGEFVVEDSQSSWCLGLLDPQGFQFGQGEFISPPIGFDVSIINSRLMSGSELSFIFDIGDSSQKRVVHYEQFHIFCINDVKLNKICSLIKGC